MTLQINGSAVMVNGQFPVGNIGCQGICWNKLLDDDFTSLSNWTVYQSIYHNITIVNGTWVRFTPTATAVGWSPASYVETSLPTEILGDFNLKALLAYSQVSFNSIEAIFIELLDSANNVVVRAGITDNWSTNSGAPYLLACASSKGGTQGSYPTSTTAMDLIISRNGDVVMFSGADANIQHALAVKPCQTPIAKVRIAFQHYSSYWDANDYFQVDYILVYAP